MTSLRFPPSWATAELYSAGPAIGTPTKVNPNSSLNGFIPGTGAAAQHMNFLLQAANSVSKRALTVAMCKPRAIPSLTLSVLGSIGVVSLGAGRQCVIATAHSGGVPRVSDVENDLGGVMASITGAMGGIARNPSTGRLVCVGTGGNRSAISTDDGGSWSAGGALGGSGLDVIYNPTYSRFQAFYADHARYSTDGAAWTDVSLSGVGQRGVAMLPNGDVAVPTGSSPLVISITTNGGTSWTTGGTVPNAASLAAGAMAGAGLDYAWHLGILPSGNLQIARCDSFSNWTAISEIAPPAGGNFGALCIKQCPQTGALWIGANESSTGGGLIYGSLDGGGTWSEPIYGGGDLLFTNSSRLWAANGRVWVVDANGLVYVSDGIGYL